MGVYVKLQFYYTDYIHNRFAYIRGCGCVFSEKALKEVPSEFCHKVYPSVCCLS